MLFYIGLFLLFSLLFAWAAAATYYAYRWASIILLLEDDLSEAIQIHERSIAVFDKILSTPLFFDSPQVKPMLDEALADIKVCRMATQKLINTFTSRSKQKYVAMIEAAAEEDDET